MLKAPMPEIERTATISFTDSAQLLGGLFNRIGVSIISIAAAATNALAITN
jgi:hypothetical protein